MTVKDPIRTSLFVAWGQQCGWCHRPLSFDQMQVDHFIPQSLKGDDLAQALHLHGLADTQDLQATTNLVPSCGRCNGIKGDRPAPATPIVSVLLDRARRLSSQIDRSAAEFVTRNRDARALAQVRAAMMRAGLDASPVNELAAALVAAQGAIEIASPGTTTIALEPTHTLVLEPGRWRITGSWSEDVVTVVDGNGRGGYTGASGNFVCPHCGLHGPWNGTRCMSCGMMSDPSD